MAGNATARQAASWVVSKGFRVLPLHSLTEAGACTCGDAACSSPGKHPFSLFAPNGLKNATADLGVVRGWFDAHYWLNYGVLTGDMLVVDIDPRNGGDKTWAAISGA